MKSYQEASINDSSKRSCSGVGPRKCQRYSSRPPPSPYGIPRLLGSPSPELSEVASDCHWHFSFNESKLDASRLSSFSRVRASSLQMIRNEHPLSDGRMEVGISAIFKSSPPQRFHY